MRGVPTRRYSLLPPAEGRLPALLPLAGEGGAKRRMRGERSELLLIFLRRPAAEQHQELSSRDGASHLSLLVQRTLAQRNTPCLLARPLAPGPRSLRGFPRGHPAPAANPATPTPESEARRREREGVSNCRARRGP